MRQIRVYAAVFILLVSIGGALRAEDRSPSSMIEQLYGELLFVMQNADDLGYEGRYEHLAPTIKSTFNLPLIARLALGKRWKSFSDTEKRTLVAAISRLTISTYASRFSGFSGEKLEVYSEEPAQKNTVLVKTALIRSNGDPVQLNYLMHRSKAGWRIADIHLNGMISEVSMRRSEYTSLLKRGGVSGLISAIDKQIASMESPAD